MIWVLGYGNELRGDDGVGPRVARGVARLHLPGVRTRTVPQLTPELAEPLARMAAVVFIDAGLGGAPGTVEVARCGEVDWLRPLGHVADPGALLALTAAVFGRAPEAWLVTVRVSNLDVGDALSATAERAVTAAVEAVRTLVARLGAETASAAGEPAEPALDPDARHRGGSADDHGHD